MHKTIPYNIKCIKRPPNLIKDYFAYVCKQAYKFSGYHEKAEYDDLVQEGCCALLKAWASFDETLGYKFLTHAAWWVRAYMFSYLESKIHLIYVPNCVRRKQSGKKHLEQITDKILSFEQVISTGTDENLKINDIVSDNSREARTIQERQEIWSLLGYLEDKHAARLIEYLGLNGDKPKTYRELSIKDHISHEAERQRIKKSVEKLRLYIKQEELKYKLYKENNNDFNK